MTSRSITLIDKKNISQHTPSVLNKSTAPGAKDVGYRNAGKSALRLLPSR